VEALDEEVDARWLQGYSDDLLCAILDTTAVPMRAVLDLYICVHLTCIYAACMYGCAPTVLLVCEDEHQAHQNWHA
jgi:hypothetical protein